MPVNDDLEVSIRTKLKHRLGQAVRQLRYALWAELHRIESKRAKADSKVLRLEWSAYKAIWDRAVVPHHTYCLKSTRVKGAWTAVPILEQAELWFWEHIAARFRSAGGAPLVITSQYRTPREQASELLKILRRGDKLTSQYSQKTSAAELDRVFAEHRGEDDAALLARLEQQISEQVRLGRAISRHLTHLAYDVRKPRQSAKFEALLKSLVGEGKLAYYKIYERHVHLHRPDGAR